MRKGSYRKRERLFGTVEPPRTRVKELYITCKGKCIAALECVNREIYISSEGEHNDPDN